MNKHSRAKEMENEELENLLRETTNKMMKEGQTPKEALGIKSTLMENNYAQAYRFYNTGKYKDAAELFRFLVMMNAMESKYMMGLAASYHMLKEYVNAIQSYTFCLTLDATNPIPHYHTADCYLQMKEYLSALLSLELAIRACGDKPEYAKLKERALLSLKSLKQKALTNPLEEIPPSSQAAHDPISTILG